MQEIPNAPQPPIEKPQKPDITHFLKSKKAKVIGLTSLVIFALILTSAIALNKVRQQQLTAKISSYEECNNSPGSKIQESYPQVCVTQDGQRFTRIISEEEEQSRRPRLTYTNDKYQYSFKYPDNFIVKEDNISDKITQVSISKDNENYLTIKTTQEYSQYDLKSITDSNLKSIREIDNAEWDLYYFPQGFENQPEPTDSTFIYVLEKNNILYMLFYSALVKTNLLRDEIISSFRFLDESGDSETWKTYTNSEYQIQFSYPKDWNLSSSGNFHKTLSNYDEKILDDNMDHGAINWDNIDQIIIKVEFDWSKLWYPLNLTALQNPNDPDNTKSTLKTVNNLSEYLDYLKYDYTALNSMRLMTKPDRNFGDYTTLQFKYLKPQSKLSTLYTIFPVEKQLISISVHADNLKGKNLYDTETGKTLDQILSTFKFLEINIFCSQHNECPQNAVCYFFPEKKEGDMHCHRRCTSHEECATYKEGICKREIVIGEMGDSKKFCSEPISP